MQMRRHVRFWDWRAWCVDLPLSCRRIVRKRCTGMSSPLVAVKKRMWNIEYAWTTHFLDPKHNEHMLRKQQWSLVHDVLILYVRMGQIPEVAKGSLSTIFSHAPVQFAEVAKQLRTDCAPIFNIESQATQMQESCNRFVKQRTHSCNTIDSHWFLSPG